MSRRVLLIGATGFFGRRLASHLAKLDNIELAITSRTLDNAAGLARSLRTENPTAVVTQWAFDRAGDNAAILGLKPWLVIETSGPFQRTGYDLARMSLEAGAHWIDIADARDYVLGFAAALDGLAKAKGLSALCGASSTPALSFAAVEDLTRGWRRVDTIDIAIFPGGGVKVGPAVIKALLSYAGRPIATWREGYAQSVTGWSWPRAQRIPGLGLRYLSPVETADDKLLTERFAVTSRVAFSAGLESRLEQFGLSTLAALRRQALIRNLDPLAPWLEKSRTVTSIGARDKGGMTVAVTGIDDEGQQLAACWSLLSGKGEGPHVPILPALALTRVLLTATNVAPGARPAAGVLPLGLIEAEMKPLALKTAHTRKTAPGRGLFANVMGADTYAALAPAVRAFHDCSAPPVWTGRADIEAGTGLMTKIIRRAIGLPASGRDVPVTVSVDRHGGDETWTRNFSGRRFSSRLRFEEHGRVTERFGPFDVILGLQAGTAGLEMPVVGWRMGRIPLPRLFAPRSDSREYQDEQGRFRFDVGISVPLLGLLARYQGWLIPQTVPPAIHPPL